MLLFWYPFDTSLLNFVSLVNLLCIVVVAGKEDISHAANVWCERKGCYHWAFLCPCWPLQLGFYHRQSCLPAFLPACPAQRRQGRLGTKCFNGLQTFWLLTLGCTSQTGSWLGSSLGSWKKGNIFERK